ncbi:MAG: PorV/PorQ family protein [Candidatus Goldiibacteriota bacterium]
MFIAPEIKKCIIIPLILFIIILSPAVIFPSGDFGTSGAEFLKIKPESRSAGMGESSIAFADGTAALTYNPAGLAVLDKAEFSFTDLIWFEGINMQYAGYAAPVGADTGLAFNAMWIDPGSFDSTGGVMPAVDLQNGFFSAGLGKKIGGSIMLGASAKGIYENFMGENSFGVSFDAGALFSVVERGFYLGVAAKNMGFLMNTPDSLPLEIGAGMGMRFYEGSHNYANVVLDFSKIINTDNIFAGAGAEYYFFKTAALRLGFRYNNAFDMETFDINEINSLIILSAGAGINIGDAFALDYSYTPMGDIGMIHRITAKIKFGESMYEQELAEKNAEFMPKAIDVPEIDMKEGRIRGVSFKPNVPETNIKEWSLSIKTSDGKIVKTFEGTGEVPKDLTWDGKNQIGQIASSEMDYVYDFRAKSTKGNVIKTAGNIGTREKDDKKEFTAPADKRYIPRRNREMLVAPVTLLISPDINERKAVPFIMENRDVDDVAEWTFYIKNRYGKTVRTFSGKGRLPSYLVWDGKDSAGRRIKEPEEAGYELEIKGRDGAKALVKEKKVLREPFAIISKTKELKMAKKIYFEKNKTEINESMKDRLDKIADEIKEHSNVQVYIQGHSSGEGEKSRNLALSRERAKAVLRYLVEKHGVSPLSINTAGYGPDIPAGPNKTEKQRIKNRRTEVIIMGETD